MGRLILLCFFCSLAGIRAQQYAVVEKVEEVKTSRYVVQQPVMQQSAYGNYSAGVTYNRANMSAPQYPPQMNQTGYQQQQNYYAQDPFKWDWDKEHVGRRAYDQEAHNWVKANLETAWNFGTSMVQGKNGQYSGSPQCGYGGNPYDTTETRNQMRGEILTQTAQWLWDNYPDQNKQPLHKAMYNLIPYDFYFLRDCMAENTDVWKGTCAQYQKYSRPDQICNNWDYPNWGAYDDIGVRITDIWNYDGGIWKKQKDHTWPSYDGTVGQLMNEKQLADLLDKASEECYNFDATMIHAYFTQFVTHDIVKSAPYTVTGGYGEQVKPKCCGQDPNCMHHSCHPIYGTAGGDGYGGGYQQTYCMEMADNVPGIDYCNPQAKDPRNLQTAYLDGSAIYGYNCEKAWSLRSGKNGKLKVNKGYYGLYSRNINLPDDPKPDLHECNADSGNPDLKCFMAGDRRVNQHPGLTAFHTVWLRLHNRMASSCAKFQEKNYLAEDVLDEICYQETRRYIQAILQNIFYRDHLPVELGPYVAGNPQYGLSMDYVVPYNPKIHASIWPEYTYAAGRLHTLISHWTQVQDQEKVAAGMQEPQSWYNIYDFLGKGYALAYSKNKLNELFSNALYDPEKCYDTSFVSELRGGWGNSQNPGGMDMFTINIARQREFGMPWYYQMREFCGMAPVYDWNSLQGTFNSHCLNTLPGIYGHVKNIESYVGMICETPMPGALVGPTAACILQRQYANIREGDRWFFDHNGLNQDQMTVVRKLNLGKILCITTNLDYTTENVFKTPNYNTNKFVSCNVYDDITEDDLSVLWTSLPTYGADYRTCKDYGPSYSGGAPGYQNTTYGAGQQASMYGNASYGQQQQYQAPPAYAAPQGYQG